MTREEIIIILKNLAKAWFGSSQQNAIHSELLRSKGLNKLADKFQEESTEEFEEAQKAVRRLIELGGKPVVEINDFPVIEDVKELITYMYNEAKEGLEEINKTVSKINDDYVTKNLIQEFILEESEHLNWLKKDLELIEILGFEGYVAEQL